MLALARIRPGERVLEIGTGRGALTRELARVVPGLVGYELDKESFEALKGELPPDVSLHHGDAFTASPEFDVLLSSLPYSESSNAVEWLARRRYDRAVLLLQRDFAEKLTAVPGSPSYRAVSVISQVSSETKIVSYVPRDSFDPPPRVNSCIVTTRFVRTLTDAEILMIKRIFSQRRKTVKAALRSLGLEPPPSALEDRDVLLQCRVGSLRPDSVLAMASALSSEGKQEDG
jgi:16S rRNA (adenine1518-N6/adenine1519-N6)-dimethyltransferase